MNLNLDLNSWIAVLSGAWLAFYILGRWQFSRVIDGTLTMVMEQGRKAYYSLNHPTVEELYAGLQPEWEAMIKKKALFILHKSELFPVPATPAIVRERFNFTPIWMGAYLLVNGIELPAAAELQEEIYRIAKLAKVKNVAKP
jgi:hypothetical protein